MLDNLAEPPGRRQWIARRSPRLRPPDKRPKLAKEINNAMRTRPLFSLFAATALAASAQDGFRPLTNTHSHNDYEQKRPLAEALEQGFCSVEADINLVNGKLLVAHSLAATRPELTLESMYLDPLRKRIKEQGAIYPGRPYFILLIDVKTAAEPTYAALEKVLENYRDVLSQFTESGCQTNHITVIVSGNRAIPVMAAEKSRLAAVDGRLDELASHPPVTLIPQVSEDWASFFHWRGTGPMPEDQRAKLRGIVQRLHSEGRTLRFWDTSDRPELWRELVDAKVDIIGADHLKRLHDFLAQPPK
jgi:hypothetical protein